MLDNHVVVPPSRVKTEMFASTLREHKQVTRMIVYDQHGPTLTNISRPSQCPDQEGLLPEVLKITKEEYHVLDNSTKDRLSMFFQVHCPERAGWVVGGPEREAYEWSEDRVLERRQPLPDSLTLMPNRIQRLADYLKQPNLTAHEISLAADVLQVQALQCKKLVMAAYENRGAGQAEDDINNEALRDEIIDTIQESLQESTALVEGEIQEARNQIIDTIHQSSEAMADGLQQMAANVRNVGEEYIQLEHSNHNHRLGMEARFTETLERRIDNGEQMYRRFVDEMERIGTRLADMEGQREKLDTIAKCVEEMAKKDARGVKRNIPEDDGDDSQASNPTTPPVKRQRGSSAESSPSESEGS